MQRTRGGLAGRVFSGLVLLLAGHASASEGRGWLFLGQYDLGTPQADSYYGVGLTPSVQFTNYDLQPDIELLRTRYGSHAVFAGLRRTTPLTRGERLSLTVGLAPGLYLHGGDGDTDLGFPLQFRTAAGLEFEAFDGTVIGVRGAHISNASLSSVNPGTELVGLYYGLVY